MTSGSAPEPAVRRLVVVSAGLGQPSSTRLLADRLVAATEIGLRTAGIRPEVSVIDVRDHAQDLVNNALTLYPPAALKAAVDRLAGADGLIAATPVYSGSYSGLFKLFFDVLEVGALAGLPTLVAATGGTARHSLVLDHAMRPLFAYLGALVLPTGVFAASDDWGRVSDPGETPLAARIERAGRELAQAMAARQPVTAHDPFEHVVPFDTLLRGEG